MTPVHSRGRSGGRYRYYVSAPLQTGGDVPRDIPRRIAAPRIEELVLAHLRTWSGKEHADWQHLLPVIRRVEAHPHGLMFTLTPSVHECWEERITPTCRVTHEKHGELRVTIPVRIQVRGGRTRLSGTPASRAKPDRSLIAGLRRSHKVLASHGIDLIERAPSFAEARGIDDPYRRSLSSLAFLAPDIQQAILTGRQPDGLSLAELMRADIPLCWQGQREMFGILPKA